MDPIVIAIAVFMFLTVFTAVMALRRKTESKDVMASRLEAFKAGESPGGSVVGAVADDDVAFKEKRSYSGIPILSNFLGGMKGSEKVANFLEQSGIPLRVGEYYMIRWACAGLFFLVPLVFGVNIFNLGLSLGLAVVGYWVPSQYVGGQRKKRKERINGQLVDLLGMVSNSLKSGYGLMQSFEFAGRQLPDPLGLEVRRMLREATLGMSAEQSLTQLGKRMESADMDMVLTAINIQRAVGGNLSEILDKVAFTMRERERIRGEIATLTSQQKMTGIVIGGLPIFMFAIFMVVNADYMSLLFTTFAGRIIMVGGIFMEVMGYFTIKKIMAIEV